MTGPERALDVSERHKDEGARGGRILLAEVDPELGALIELQLTRAGYAVTRTETGDAAVAAAGKHTPDIVLLDAELPDIDGPTVCHQIRRNGCDAPVILLTPRDLVPDRALGGCGAFAQVVKPVIIEELLARMRTAARRADDGWVAGGRVHLRPDTREVRADGEGMQLTAQEFDLLAFLMTAQGCTFTRERIYESVWGGELPSQTKAVDLAVCGLRRKLGIPGDALIRTVRRVGYMALT